MALARRAVPPALITGAADSLDDQRSHLRRTHLVMALGYAVGFGAGYPVSLWHGWAGAVVLAAGSVAPWLWLAARSRGPVRRRAPRPGPSSTGSAPTGSAPAGAGPLPRAGEPHRLVVHPPVP